MLLALFGAVPALAQSYDENPSGNALYVLADGRLSIADGERSWIDGGFGKIRLSGDADGDARLRARPIEGDVVWQPHLGWSLGATIAATAQQGQQHAVDLSEAYLTYRHAPLGAVKLSARLGLLWPPISTEHSGPAWTVTDTITPSAINSWVGEEVKVVAGEGSASVPLGDGRVTATAALFGLNDTAGTLLTFRGWALHDEKATAFGLQRLPPLNAFMIAAQAPRTSPVIELDNRPGVYAKIGWTDPRAMIAAFYYDNRADPEAVDNFLQWGWRTRFGNLSLRFRPDARWTITSQAMLGTTRMGYRMPDRLWVDTQFRSAFLLGTRRFADRFSVSGRVEAFGTRGRGSVEGAETSEDGWATTAAAKWSPSLHLSVLAEALHVDSRRDERARVGLPPRERQTIGQMALRATL